MRNSVNKAENGSTILDQVFKALGDPHRLQIMHLLKEREMSAGEILEELDVVQSTLSHHMKSLTEAGAVNAVRRGKWTYYSINTDTMKEAEALLNVYSLGTRVKINFTAPQAEDHDTPAEKNSASSPKKGASGKKKEKENEKTVKGENRKSGKNKKGKKSRK